MYRMNEDWLMHSIRIVLEDCDYDTLAQIAGQILGGECFVTSCKENPTDETSFDFIPDENYGGAFDDLVECPILEPSDQ